MPSDQTSPAANAAVRAEFDEAYEGALRALESGEGGLQVAALLSRRVDAIVAGLFGRALAELGRDQGGIALLAVGGYGREELAPHSDIDLLLVHRGRREDELAELVRLVVYPLWDSGRQIGHRVRTIPETLRIMSRVDEACATLDARLLAGDPMLAAELDAAVLERLHRGRAGYFRDLAAENRERHTKQGHAGHLLEPDLRDSAGGLRDIHTLRWAGRVLPGAAGLDGLVSLGYLTQRDRDLVELAAGFLLTVRVHLHFHARRHQDRLYLGDQGATAASMSLRPQDGTDAPDALMREVYRHARAVDAVVSSYWERMTHRPGRRLLRRQGVSGDGWVVRDGRFEVVAVTPPQTDPAGWLRMFAQTITVGARMGRASLDRLHGLLAAGGRPVTWTPQARTAFGEILSSGRAGVAVMEQIDDAGLLAALVPEWERVRCAPQRNPYHRYTVDVHLLETVGALAESASSTAPEDADAWSRVPDAERLLLVGLLHDIGKGMAGDHCEAGARLARTIATRIGLDDAAVDDVELCVREHLLLPEVATRRDLNDPRTIADVASRAGSAPRLAMLFLLARADAAATGPEASSPFRTALVRELYAKAMRVLERGESRPGDGDVAARIGALAARARWPVDEVERAARALGPAWLLSTDAEAGARQLALMRVPPDGDEVRVEARGGDTSGEIVVVARDRPGLFAAVTGVLALRGVDVLAADIHTSSDGVALEVFRVASLADEYAARWDSIRRDIAGALDASLDVEAALARKDRERLPRPADVVPVATRVLADNTVSDLHTVVEVHARDRTGLLHAIARALADARCDLRLAKVATYGAQVVDVFYVQELGGRRMTDTACRDLEGFVLDRLVPATATDDSGRA